MRFMIIDKNRITFPALVSNVFSSPTEAKNYGFTKPKKDQADVYHIENGFKLTELINRLSSDLQHATTNTRTIECGKLTLYLKDSSGLCEIEEF
jgi:hypothetical protein